jgi:hypothetical protein
MKRGNVNDLLHPYADNAGGGETETGGMDEGEGFEFLTTHQSSDPTPGDGAHYKSHQKTFSPVFEECVSEFLAAPDQKDYYKLLGVSQDAAAEEIRDAYYKLVKF